MLQKDVELTVGKEEVLQKEVELTVGKDEMLQKEVELTQQCLMVNPKSYGAWHHRSWSLEHMDKPSWERELALCERYLGTFYCTVLRELESGVRANNGWLWICNMLKCAMVAVHSCLPYTPPPLLTIARSCTLDNILVIFINIINHLQVLETR